MADRSPSIDDSYERFYASRAAVRVYPTEFVVLATTRSRGAPSGLLARPKGLSACIDLVAEFNPDDLKVYEWAQRVAPGQPVNIPLSLEVGSLEETVNVTSSAELINTQTATVASGPISVFTPCGSEESAEERSSSVRDRAQ